MKQNLIQTRTFDFAVDTINLYKQMVAKNEYVLSKQLLRSGTSIGANVEEAIAGQSKKDFLSKMNISLKEARETNYWLRLFKASKIVDLDFNPSLKESQELVNILSAIVKTTKQNS
ncbi:MAG: four helix bundle protein [Bacteroidota bacterium]|nr:four helix bundle protein [Bacteroidota bacterium]